MTGLVGGENSRSGIIGLERNTVVYTGWNSNSPTTSGSWQPYPLDSDVISVNTRYMTKSTNTFTGVAGGMYLVQLNTMGNYAESYYAHHRMLKNGNHYISTHDYGSSGSSKWTGHNYSVVVEVPPDNTIAFHGYMPSGGSTIWHNYHSYSQLNIIFLHL